MLYLILVLDRLTLDLLHEKQWTEEYEKKKDEVKMKLFTSFTED